MNNIICDEKYCSGCKLCQNLCPKKCIKFIKNDIGIEYPTIDINKCISCGLCKKVCPSLKEHEFVLPRKAYVAWNSNNLQRCSGASGGIAQAIYEYALDNDISVYGVIFEKKLGAKYVRVKDKKDLEEVKNSKYVYSDLSYCFKDIDEDIINNKKIIFIGLPCHVAAIKIKFELKKKLENLICIDIICHGTPPSEYLINHLAYLENKLHKEICKITFRNPKSSYKFSLYDSSNKIFYSKSPNEDDVYYKGFMSNLILRENCFNCRYAQSKRISDITIGDFDGLNDQRLLDKKQCSLVLTTTLKGEMLLNELIENKKIITLEQDVITAMKKNKQLHKPAVRHHKRNLFEAYYKKYNDFEKSAKKTYKKEIYIYKIMYVPNKIKVKILGLFSRKVKDKIKEVLKYNRK